MTQHAAALTYYAMLSLFPALLVGVVDSWVGPIADTLVALGSPAEDAQALARLGVAVTRGLLLDLLATEDRKAVAAAMEQWIGLNARARAW